MTTQRNRVNSMVVCAVACALAVLGVMAAPLLAAPADLPPRPTPPKPYTRLPGEHIVLEAEFGDGWAASGREWQAMLTVVQWQDAWGAWHDVKGWRGGLDDVGTTDGKIIGTKSWWVPDDLFGDGPFRWVVLTEVDGDAVVLSDEFSLPERAGQPVVLNVALSE